MKRLITFISLIIVIIIGFSFVTNGFEKLNIASYDTIETKSEALTKKLAIYDKKNQEEYDSAVTGLNSSIKSYKDSKAKYDQIFEELAEVLNKDTEDGEEVIEDVIYSDKEKYKVDFLLVTLGDYGEKEGVDVVYQLATSSTTDPNSTTLNYFLADLNFTVTGQYMNVSNFIYDLENNEKLNWEIRNFSMETGSANGYNGVSAKFTIKDVPIDSESYIESNGAMVSNDMDNNEQNPNASSTNNNNNNSSNGSVTNTTSQPNTQINDGTASNTVSNNTVQ